MLDINRYSPERVEEPKALTTSPQVNLIETQLLRLTSLLTSTKDPQNLERIFDFMSSRMDRHKIVTQEEVQRLETASVQTRNATFRKTVSYYKNLHI